jgi:hypothetical protein
LAETPGTVPGKAETVVPWLTGLGTSIIVFVAGSSFRDVAMPPAIGAPGGMPRPAGLGMRGARPRHFVPDDVSSTQT